MKFLAAHADRDRKDPAFEKHLPGGDGHPTAQVCLILPLSPREEGTGEVILMFASYFLVKPTLTTLEETFQGSDPQDLCLTCSSI